MVSGIPSVPAFVAGLLAGAVLYVAGIPSMMLGLGVYLPFYMSISTVLGAVVALGIRPHLRRARCRRGVGGRDRRGRGVRRAGR